MGNVDNHYEEMRKMHEKMDKQRITRLAERAMREVNRVKEFAKSKNLLDSQEYIDFEDELNAFSVADHEAEEIIVEEAEKTEEVEKAEEVNE